MSDIAPLRRAVEEAEDFLENLPGVKVRKLLGLLQELERLEEVKRETTRTLTEDIKQKKAEIAAIREEIRTGQKALPYGEIE